jgi:predicted acetyltransferase
VTRILDVAITHAAKPAVIERLLDAYLEELLGAGHRDYPYLSRYWSEPDRHPFVILADRRTAGFALVRDVEPDVLHEMSEFYVVPALRRQGVGRRAATLLFERFGGRWQLQFAVANARARSFWRFVVPAATETPNPNVLVHTMTWIASNPSTGTRTPDVSR